MNNPLLSVETPRWQRARRRWALILGGLLTINAALVAIALASYSSVLPEPVSEVSVAESPAVAANIPLASSAATEVVEATTTEVGDLPATEPAPVADTNERSESVVASIPAVSAAANGDAVTFENRLPEALSNDSMAIVVGNPVENGGAVSFLFQETVFTLEAGECVSLGACDDAQIVYHRGDELADAECDCPPGCYFFDVSSSGWQLNAANDTEAAILLSNCRPAGTNTP